MKKLLLIILFVLFTLSCGFFSEAWEPSDIVNALYPNADTTPPVVTVSSPTNHQTTATNYTIIGTVEDESSQIWVFVAVDGGSYFRATVDGADWHQQLTVSSYGFHTNSIYAQDQEGNTSLTQSLVIFADNIPIVAFLNVSNTYSTNVLSIYLDVSATVNSPLSITNVESCVNSAAWTSASNTGGNVWRCLLSLNEGTNNVLARATSSRGSSSESLPVQVIVTVPVPSISLAFPPTGWATNVNPLVISGTASVNVSYSILKVQTCLNLGAWTDAEGTTSWSNSLTLTEGTNTLSARAITSGFKTNETGTVKVIYDTTAPAFSVDAPVVLVNTYSNHYTLDCSASDSGSGVEGVYLSLNGGAFGRIGGAGQTLTNFRLPDGVCITNTLTFYAADFAGNTNAVVVQRRIVVKNKLVPTIISNYAQYGNSVSISTNGTKVIVGDKYYNGSGCGAAYTFFWNGIQWLINYIIPGDLNGGYNFGASVDIDADGSRIIAGAPGATGNGGALTGAVYIFDWGGSAWNESDKVYAAAGAASDHFGASVCFASNGYRFIAGAPVRNHSTGAAYLYKWNGASWDETILTASDGDSNHTFGNSVALSEDGGTVVVGASCYDYGTNLNQGCAYVYTWNGSGWTETNLKASSGGYGHYFGSSVAVSSDGSIIVVGADHGHGAVSTSGAAYVYRKNGSVWEETRIYASDGLTGDSYGFSAAISPDGNVIAVGATQENNNKTGVVYLYRWSGSVWTESKLMASNAANLDKFGSSVGLSTSGRNLTIGACTDDAVGSAWIYRTD